MDAIRRCCGHVVRSTNAQWRRIFGRRQPLLSPRLALSTTTTRRERSPVRKLRNRRSPGSQGRIEKITPSVQPARTPRKTWTIEQCVSCLQQLVYSLDKLEATEELRNILHARVRDLLPEGANFNIEKNIFGGYRDELAKQIDQEFYSLQAQVQDFVRDYAGASGPELPEYITTQLDNYSSSKAALGELRTAKANEILEPRIPPHLRQAKTPQRSPGSNSSDRGPSSEIESHEICRAQNHFMNTVKELCKDQVPRALQDDVLVGQEISARGTGIISTTTAIHNAGLLGPPARLPIAKTDPIPAPVNEQVLQEWKEAQEEFKESMENHLFCQSAVVREHEENELRKAGVPMTERIEALNKEFFGTSAQEFQELQVRERVLIQARNKAMEAGLQPQEELYFDLDTFPVHLEDGTAWTADGFKEGSTAVGVANWNKPIQEWLERTTDGRPSRPESVVSMQPWTFLPVGMGDSRSQQESGNSAGPHPGQRARIQRYRDTCETWKKLADEDYAQRKVGNVNATEIC